MVKKQYQTFGETVGGRSFPNAAEAKIADVLGVPIVVKDADFKIMQHGEVAILLFEFLEGENAGTDFSVLVGGEVVRKKVKEAVEKKLLPLSGVINHDEVYYDIF